MFQHRDGVMLDVLRCEPRALLTASADGTVRLWDAEAWVLDVGYITLIDTKPRKLDMSRKNGLFQKGRFVFQPEFFR